MLPAFRNPAHELLPADNASFHSILTFARCLLSGQHGCSCLCLTADQMSSRKVFKLSPSLYTPLLDFLRNRAIESSDLEKFDDEAKTDSDSDVGLDLALDFDKLRIEFDPDDGLLTFKMPAKRVHNLFTTLIGRQVADAVSPFVQGFDAWGEVDITTDVRNKGNKMADMGWGRIDSDANPPVVAEVAYASPANRGQLQDRCMYLLNRTRNRIRTVLAFNIFCNYSNTNDFEAILENLNECYVAVWVMYDGVVSNVMGWTPFSDADAHVCLYTSDTVLDTSEIHQEEVRQFLHSSSGEDTGNRSPNIRIPMSDIEKMLRSAVHSSILKRDDDESREREGI